MSLGKKKKNFLEIQKIFLPLHLRVTPLTLVIFYSKNSVVNSQTQNSVVILFWCKIMWFFFLLFFFFYWTSRERIMTDRLLWRSLGKGLIIMSCNGFYRFFLFINILGSKKAPDIPPSPNSNSLKKRQKIPSEAYDRQGFSLFTVKASKLEINLVCRKLCTLAFEKRIISLNKYIYFFLDIWTCLSSLKKTSWILYSFSCMFITIYIYILVQCIISNT